MGRPGACTTCYAPKRAEIETARAAGTSYAELARRFGVPATSIRRHYDHGHVRPAPAVARRAPAVARHTVTMEHLRTVAAEFSLPIEDVVFHHLHCRKGDIALVSDAEGDELLEMMRAHATDEEFAEMFPA